MTTSRFTRFALAAFVAIALSGLPQLATAKPQPQDMHFTKQVDKSSP
jgi:hypothetical protein